MSDGTVNESINKRIIFIGDDKTGKTTVISAFVESNPCKKLNKVQSNDVQINDLIPSVNQNEKSNSDGEGENPDNANEKQADNSENAEKSKEENGIKAESAEDKKKADKKSKKKKVESEESEIESDDSEKEDPKLAAEIDALLVYATLKQDEQTYELAIWDAEKEKDFKKNRAVVYQKADVIVLLYSIDSPGSYRNVTKKWKPHLKKNLKRNKNCPVILVGNKLDLRIKRASDEESDEEEEKLSMTTEDGKKLAKKIGAIDYLECSAINKEGIFEIFAKAAQYNANSNAAKGSKCIIS